MKRIESHIEINAPAERVWAVLTQFESHGGWDPFFESMQGELSEGARLKIRFRKGFTMQPRITELRDGKVLEWLGSVGVRGIFDGRHRFEVLSQGERTLLRHSEQFSGVLVPLLGSMLRDTEGDFQAFNAALKARAEDRETWAARPV